MSKHEDKLEFLKEIKEEDILPIYTASVNGFYLQQPAKPKQFRIELGGSSVIVHEDGTVEINATKGIKFSTLGDVEFDAKNVKMNASQDIKFGSANNISQQAPTIHLNPENDASGYKKG